MARQLTQPAAGDPALDALCRLSREEPAVLLHSGRAHPRWATRSILARPQLWFRYRTDANHAGISELVDAKSGEPHPLATRLSHRPWDDLRLLLNHADLPGRWFGFFSYDLCRVIEHRKLTPLSSVDWPLIELAWCPDAQDLPVTPSPDEAGTQRRAVPGSHASGLGYRIGDLTPNFTRDAYLAAVQRVLDYIAAGDVFQVNLAQRFAATFEGDPRALFRRLATISPAWYGAYLELPGRRALLSTSPELFLDVRDRRVITRPIKGTRPAHVSADVLRDAEKDTAELNMIVDLMRNDLGRVCAYGSVRVDEPRTIETHPTVHHGVATISGQLHESKDVVDLLRATLPGGSVTGAPKVRAMQIIDELEPHPRGPYCGSIGYVSRDEACLNIAIRTITRDLDELTFSVGGGIVADSQPADEYDETLTKANAMLRALGLSDEDIER